MNSRNFSIVAYGDREQIYHFCTSKKVIKNYAFIFHNLDDNEPHFHILIHMNNSFDQEEVIGWLKDITGQNAFAQVISNKSRAYEYLIHENDENKHSYSVDQIITNDKYYWYTPDEKSVEILNDLLQGCDLYAMALRYGRDFIINYKKYQDFVEILKNPIDKH